MAKPTVRDLNKLVATIGKSVQPQKAILDQSIADNATAGVAQEAGLKATAEQAYGQIEQGAQNKGMLFSGFSPDEQAKYNAGTYLPALANLQSTIAQTRASLLGRKADLDTDVFNKAFTAREGDRAVVNDWKKMTAQQQFDARQAALTRDFQAKESSKDRAAAASNAANSGSSPADVLDADRRTLAAELSKVTGGDGYVSPGSYATSKNAWVASGYSGKTFDSYFASYRNPKNKAYKISKK